MPAAAAFGPARVTALGTTGILVVNIGIGTAVVATFVFQTALFILILVVLIFILGFMTFIMAAGGLAAAIATMAALAVLIPLIALAALAGSAAATLAAVVAFPLKTALVIAALVIPFTTALTLRLAALGMAVAGGVALGRATRGGLTFLCLGRHNFRLLVEVVVGQTMLATGVSITSNFLLENIGSKLAMRTVVFTNPFFDNVLPVFTSSLIDEGLDQVIGIWYQIRKAENVPGPTEGGFKV